MLRFSIFTTAFLALAMSIFAIFVITYAGAKEIGENANVFHYGTMQIFFLVLATIIGTILIFLDYRIFKRDAFVWGISALAILSLLLVLCPGIGVSVKGAQRWIGLGPLRVQPVEFVKLSMVIVLSAHMDRIGGIVNRIFSWKKFRLPIFLIGGAIGLLILQPDFGGAIIVCALAGLMLLVGGVSLKECLIIVGVAVVCIGIFICSNENRMKRLQNHSEGESYQVQQSEIAFQNGGLTGKGMGKGMQRQGYLPECHTDFILSVIGEDFGFVGISVILSCFLTLLMCGLTISFHAPDKQGMLLAFGATMMVCAQAAGNMAVVTAILPTKGLALPFFSYGGSSLLSSFFAIGLLLSVGRRALLEKESIRTTRPVIHSI
jgi:cell division protein FtsW